MTQVKQLQLLVALTFNFKVGLCLKQQTSKYHLDMLDIVLSYINKVAMIRKVRGFTKHKSVESEINNKEKKKYLHPKLVLLKQEWIVGQSNRLLSGAKI